MVQRKRKWRNKFKKNLPKYVKKQKIIMQPFNLTRLNMFLHTQYGRITMNLIHLERIWNNLQSHFTKIKIFGKWRSLWIWAIQRNRLASPNDPKVKATIQCIIEEFFLTNPNILCISVKQGITVKQWEQDYSKMV